MRRHVGRPESGLVATKVQRVVVGVGAVALVAAILVVRPWHSLATPPDEGGTLSGGFGDEPAARPAPPPATAPEDEKPWHYVPGRPVAAPPAEGVRTTPARSQATEPAADVLFREAFDDPGLAARGWYDNRAPVIATGAGRRGGALEVRFAKGYKTAVQGGALRHTFAPSEGVVVSFWVRYGAGWRGSGKSYHPHEFHVLTTADNDYIGPSATHLTTYIEHAWRAGGVPRLAITDALNIDTTQVNKDLTRSTERRAVAGCNGGPGTCYRQAGWRNGVTWDARAPAFLPEGGAGSATRWHRVEVEFRLNSIRDGKGQADGVARYWVDGNLVIDQRDVLFRTAAQPDLRFNQFVIAPYIGDGSPVEQTMWVDDLVVATGRVAE